MESPKATIRAGEEDCPYAAKQPKRNKRVKKRISWCGGAGAFPSRPVSAVVLILRKPGKLGNSDDQEPEWVPRRPTFRASAFYPCGNWSSHFPKAHRCHARARSFSWTSTPLFPLHAYLSCPRPPASESRRQPHLHDYPSAMMPAHAVRLQPRIRPCRPRDQRQEAGAYSRELRVGAL